MPKTKRPPLPADELPIWDALVAELGDPRPYDPTEIGGSFEVPDDAFDEEHVAADTIATENENDFLIARTAIDDVDNDATDALDAIWTPPRPPVVAVVPTTDATAFVPLTAVLNVGEITVELPVVTEERP